MGTLSVPGVKQPGRGVDLPPTSMAEVKERGAIHVTANNLCTFVSLSGETFTFTFPGYNPYKYTT